MLEPTKDKIYDNCAAVDKDGNIMFCCDHRKMMWYLKRNLAELVQEDPPRIRFLFEPKGKGHVGDPFFVQPRENKCVVCGTSESLTRHHIVPHCYRKHFPRDLDRYGPYDVMPLCVKHHDLYNKAAEKLNSKLAKRYNIPINGVGGRSCATTSKIVTEAYALLRYRDTMPASKVKKLENKVAAHFDVVSLTDEAIQKFVNENKAPQHTFSKLLVDQFSCDYHKIGQFMVLWRKHFLRKMRPKFMPEHWDPERVFLSDIPTSDIVDG